MTRGGERATDHYTALGVHPDASPRLVERAFQRWTERLRAGEASLDAYRRAESAYHQLADPVARARHDRQLGRVAHPAWDAGRRGAVATSLDRALAELAAGRAGRARLHLERAVVFAPADVRARSYLALALARSGGSLHEAARHGLFAVERQPQQAAWLFNLAEVYAAAGLGGRALAWRIRGWRAVVRSLFRSAAGV